jgi:pimeloyl-ACP methyl ester carboxylesterase
MKTVLFVPGFQESLKSRDYCSVIKAIESKGYNVTFVPIQWQRTTIRDWLLELDRVYAACDPKETILAGFSYGAMTAFLAAVKRNPAELWLFSLSPYFSDDIPTLKKSWLNSIGHRRVDAFRELDFDSLVQSIACKTLIVVGEVEAQNWPPMGARSKAAHKAIANSKLITVPGVGHDVAHGHYVAAIQNTL